MSLVERLKQRFADRALNRTDSWSELVAGVASETVTEAEAEKALERLGKTVSDLERAVAHYLEAERHRANVAGRAGIDARLRQIEDEMAKASTTYQDERLQHERAHKAAQGLLLSERNALLTKLNEAIISEGWLFNHPGL